MSVLLSVLRAIGISLPGLIALFLVARAIFDENLSDIRYAAGLLLIFALTLLIRAETPQAPSARGAGLARVFLIGLPIFLIYPITVVVLIFGKTDMAAFVFHLVFGMDGTPWVDLIPYLLTAAVFWLVFSLSVFRLRAWLNRIPLAYAAIGACVLAMNPLVYDLAFNRAAAAYGARESLKSEYVVPEIIDAPQRPNLIYLYLEGYERGYLSEALLGGRTAPMRQIEANALAFSNIHQVEATGWSLAGSIATQCGVPMLPLGARPLDSFSEVKLIVPEMTCLGDVLSDRGYHLTYMSGTQIVGNKMGFYGFDNFVTTHGFDEIQDRNSIELARTDALKGSKNDNWALYDSELLSTTLNIVKERDPGPDPFAVFVATMDTHGPDGVISPECRAPGEPAVLPQMEPSIACTAQLVEAFLTDLAAMVDMQDYRVIITSDHLSHRNNLTELLNTKPRRNTVMLMGGDTAATMIERPGSSLDIYPTILDWLGLLSPSNTRAGLGASLIGADETLLERFGVDDVNARLKVDVDLAQFIWQ